MKKITNDNLILWTVILTLILSIVYLAWTEKMQSDPTVGKSWWAVSFTDPISSSNDIFIENFSPSEEFTVLLNDQEFTTLNISQGSTTIVEIPTGNADLEITHPGGSKFLKK